MHFLTAAALFAASLVAATPVDMGPYKAGAKVDPAFAKFVEEYYRVSEDKLSTTALTDLFSADGQLIAAGNPFRGAKGILGIRQALLPPNGNKAWWHLIESATFVGEDAKTQTVSAKIVVQTTFTPGNCSQAHGNAAFTVAKDAKGVPNWVPHTGGLLVYNLTVNTIQTPTNEPCTASKGRRSL
ncbi:hypothetical protein RB600_009137 [Gaeumannomyces tritici]